ncbi:MAG: L-seryl-tRNA(Sec) selenium transferase [Candidatus Dormibacteraeota bacterium]|uniref:L-seryl-tRNA(Sec) selenium transferase n=1 Tax=Candidatus Amunia macphersoniae TaxID=3127014 RepID=A0A934KP79_9BACT|nr:L-seryl-tRNA(Sec) selenium transferase [Candidatus Dormibacteraeota bacterium]
MPADPRRSVPSTDVVLSDGRLIDSQRRLGRQLVRSTVRATQDHVRSGVIEAADLVDEVLRRLPRRASTLRPVLNATGVILHTNLGRAALSSAARDAVAAATGYVDVEFDLATGERAQRGRGALAALRAALPDAGDVLVVNNGAAALLLAVTALAQGREVIWSRGEMVEIGDGFRLPELVASTGAIVREVGTTNRTARHDYLEAVGERTGCLLKVHPSNFRMAGFTSSVTVAELAGLGPPLVVDVGSGLLTPDALLPGEPDVSSALRAGADLVTASGDKLLGGPQAGIIAGRADLVARLRRHPMARAMRVDKLTLAALEATMCGPATPTATALHVLSDELRTRAEAIAARLGDEAAVVPSEGAVGGGGAPGVVLPGWAVSLPGRYALPLRTGDPAVVGRVERGRCLLDVRCIDPGDDDALLSAVLACR